MASRGYYFDFVDGERYAVPAPGVVLCPARCREEGCNGFPKWLFEFTRGDIWYFRRFGEYPTYSLEKLGDGSFEFRDIDIDTVMYTMTPVYDESGLFDGYTVEWLEHVSDDCPEKCPLDDECILPMTDDGTKWGVFEIDLTHLVFPVYHLNYTKMVLEDGGEEEDVVEYECRYLLDLYYETYQLYGVQLWEYSSESLALEFQFDRGEYDTQGRRLYALRWVDCSVLFDDDGFALYDDDGDRVGNAVRYDHVDDEGYNDGWGVDSLASLAYESYIGRFSSDTRREKSTEIRKEIWDSSVEAEENPLDKILRMCRMPLDAYLESSEETWPVDMPINWQRPVNGTDYVLAKTKANYWEVREKGEVVYTVKFSWGFDEGTWNFYGTDGQLVYSLVSVGDGTFDFKSAAGEKIYTVCPDDSYASTGEYSQENLYPGLLVKDSDGWVAYTIGRPTRSDDPFEDITFVEFSDNPPLRKVDGAWVTYSGNPKYFEAVSDNVNYWKDLYDSRNELAYRISKPNERDDADREVYSVYETKVATMSLLSITSDKTGNEVAKFSSDPTALYTYQLFDNGVGDYNYLTHYSNDMVVVVDREGKVVCYVTPDGDYRDYDWNLIGYVTAGNKVVDPKYNTLYTFKQSGGDYNLYDADGNLVGHLYSSSTPNNEWVIGAGMQRLFTFLSTETKAVISSNGDYVFVGEKGDYLSGDVKVQAESSGDLVLTVRDEDGGEMYRIAASNGTYQINAANGSRFDTAVSYETLHSGNTVLTRYWSVPYNRMMYSCTNDQPEGAFDDIIGGYAAAGAASDSPARYSVGGVAVRSVSDPGIRVLASSEDDSADDSGGESSGGGLGSPDSIQDLIDSMSDFFDGVNGILAKDTNTSKGDDLDPDNPLAMAQAETDGRSIANAAFGSGLTTAEKHALTDAYDYTQAITRVSKMYSLARADIYKEAQDYAETRTKRIEAKKAAFTNVLERTKARVEREQG